MWRIVGLSRLSSLQYFFARACIAPYSTAEANITSRNEPSIGKEVLLKMRKETGYSYVKCRKALVACGGEQNYEQALRWVREAAAKEGWDKAAKLSNRKASQGLIGYASPFDNICVLIELNCETDFVARSAEFKNLVAELVNALKNHIPTISKANDQLQNLDLKHIEPDKFHLMDGRTAEEAIVSTVGKVGENIKLARATIISSSPLKQLYGQTHPKEELNGVQMGRFVSLVSLSCTSKDNIPDFPAMRLGQQICQHIIGMAPESLGKPEKKMHQTTSQEENTSKETEPDVKTENDTEEEDLNVSQVDQSELTRMDENETRLLHQPFMLNPELTVSEYLEQYGANVSDFLRIEMGQENIGMSNSSADQ